MDYSYKGGDESKININFFETTNSNNQNNQNKHKNLFYSASNILNLCFLKYISRNMENNIIEKIKSPKIKQIIYTLKQQITFKNILKEDIKAIL